ncbi:anti-sigma factor family protein, partial [Roseibium sp.]|uniref:anti-sigma factor family protein n=1 Tax=Roseibium sp. TaxID=1936156 RepID=UPI003D0FDE72
MSGDDRPVTETDIQAFIDGRLAPQRAKAVERLLEEQLHLHADIAKDREIANRLRAELDPIAREPLPYRLQIPPAPERSGPLRLAGTLAAGLALFVLGGTTGWYAAHRVDNVTAPQATMALAALPGDAAVAYRTYAVEVRHPVEVDASEAAHLSAWLSKRIGGTVSIPDLSKSGFALVGGRLLPSSAGAAGQLMYENPAGERVTLYLRKEGGEQMAFRFASEGAVNGFYWVGSNFGYALSGELSRDRLFALA